MIVGVDSGTWRAFAALDFNGNLVALESRKNWEPGDFIRSVSNYSPTVIACDKLPVPKKVLLLKSIFGARLYKPSKSLSLIQKSQLTRDFKPENSHERDALACALKACRSLHAKLDAIEEKAKNAGLSAACRELVKRMVLRGESVDRAVKRVKVMG